MVIQVYQSSAKAFLAVHHSKSNKGEESDDTENVNVEEMAADLEAYFAFTSRSAAMGVSQK